MPRFSKDLSAETLASSLSCALDLNEHHLLKKCVFLRPKTIGHMEGVVLFSPTKRFSLPEKPDEIKTTFVKKFYPGSVESELIDAVVMGIAKKCGVIVPKVKLKYTTNHIYFFSTGLGSPNSKHPEKHYEFVKLKELKKRSIILDNQSVARFVIISVIFGLFDLVAENMGIRISTKGREEKNKLALVDFLVDMDHRLDIRANKQKTFREIIKEYSNGRLPAKLVSLSQNYSDDDYFNAFEKIRLNFLGACCDARRFVNEQPASVRKKSQTLSLIECWENNFNYFFIKILASSRPAQNTRR